jgi:hypothetical protein
VLPKCAAHSPASVPGGCHRAVTVSVLNAAYARQKQCRQHPTAMQGWAWLWQATTQAAMKCDKTRQPTEPRTAANTRSCSLCVGTAPTTNTTPQDMT